MTNNDVIDVGVLMLTARCDVHCAFCIADNAMVDLDPEDVQQVLEALAHQGIKKLVLGGGEPFCWRGDLFSLARKAKRYNFEVQVGTNGNHFEKDMARRNEIDRWVLPLESARQKKHDSLRTGRGSSYNNVMKILDACREAGREVTISTLVSKENFDQLEPLADWLESWVESGGKLHAWHLYLFQPEGRGGQVNAHRFLVPYQVYRQFCYQLRQRHPGLNILLRPDMYHSRKVAFFWCQDRRLMRRDKNGLVTVLCQVLKDPPFEKIPA